MMHEIFALLADSKAIVISYSMSLLGAIVLLVAGWVIARWAQRVVRRLMDRSTVFDATLKPLVASIVRYTILIFVLIAVLAQFGVQTASIIAVLGAAGLAIGLALQGTLANIAAGVMILALRPFKVDETIDAEGIKGTVDYIGLFTTVMHSIDGIYTSVPNGQLWNRTIKNLSRRPIRRVEVVVGIGYGDDIDRAIDVAKSLLLADRRVRKEPPVEVEVLGLGDSAVTLSIKCWVKTTDFPGASSDFTKGVKQAFDRAGISIPYPRRDIHYIGDSPIKNPAQDTVPE